MFESPARLFGEYSPVPLNDAAVPPFAALEADDEDERQPESRDFDFERPQHAWAPIPPAAPPADAPVRFVDGSIASRTVASIRVGYRLRPVLAATISAACLEIEGRSLRRSAVRTAKVLCLNTTGIEPAALLQAERLIEPLGLQLRSSEAEAHADFDSLRRAIRSVAMEAMEDAERDVMLADATRPTLVDGLLERRLASGARHDLPVVGLVKRQIATYLPPGLQELAYSLKPGERTPAFLLKTEHVDIVNCYVRLSSQPGASPSYGIVRLTAPLEYVQRHHAGEALTAYFSGLAGYIYKLRHRDLAYDRAGISIEPIVRVEEHLHALRPNLDILVQKLHRLLQPAPAEVTYGLA
jgi:hypothetical protein